MKILDFGLTVLSSFGAEQSKQRNSIACTIKWRSKVRQCRCGFKGANDWFFGYIWLLIEAKAEAVASHTRELCYGGTCCIFRKFIHSTADSMVFLTFRYLHMRNSWWFFFSFHLPRMRCGWWWCMWHMNVQLCVHQWLLYNTHTATTRTTHAKKRHYSQSKEHYQAVGIERWWRSTKEQQ